MKKIILLSCFISFGVSAGNSPTNAIAAYQELCAKEQDPVKRKNYCYMLERHDRSSTIIHDFKKETAIG